MRSLAALAILPLTTGGFSCANTASGGLTGEAVADALMSGIDLGPSGHRVEAPMPSGDETVTARVTVDEAAPPLVLVPNTVVTLPIRYVGGPIQVIRLGFGTAQHFEIPLPSDRGEFEVATQPVPMGISELVCSELAPECHSVKLFSQVQPRNFEASGVASVRTVILDCTKDRTCGSGS